MHIAEGVLSAPVLAGGAGLTVLLLWAGLKRLPWSMVMPTALLAAAFLAASLIHINLGVGDIHLLLSGLLGCVLGMAAVPAIFAAVCLQALLFQMGGLTTLGVNTCFVAIPAVLSALIFRPFMRVRPANDKGYWQNSIWIIAAFICGAFSQACSATLAALALWLSGGDFGTAALTLLAGSLVVMFLEGAVTVVIVGLLRKEKPDIFQIGQIGTAPAVPYKRSHDD